MTGPVQAEQSARLRHLHIRRRPNPTHVIFCVQAVISPLLANLYMNRFLKYWRITERGKALRAHVVNYADDFVILTRRRAGEAREWTRGVMERLGLTLNEAKTQIKEAWQESFDFLGYTFGAQCYRKKGGRKYLGAWPSKKSVARLRQKVNAVLVPSNTRPWPEVRHQLNRLLRGWSGYFCYGTRSQAYRAVDRHVEERVRNFLRRRHRMRTRGTRVLPAASIFGALGVLGLREVHRFPSVRESGDEPCRRAGCGKSARPVR